MDANERDALRAALGDALEAARIAEGRGDREQAQGLYESAAELALQLGEGTFAPEEEASVSPDEGPVEGPEPRAAERVAAAGTRPSKAPPALVWKSVERDLRVFFFRNLPAVADSLREDFERAKDLGERQAMVEGFREIGHLLVLLAQMRHPKRVL